MPPGMGRLCGRRWWIGAVVLTATSTWAQGGHTDVEPSVDQYNVTWTTPSEGPSGSMPIGNGQIGLNVWVEQGALVLYIATTDAWSENGRLLKLGRVRVTLDPDPFQEGQPFEQTLRLRQGDILVRAGAGDLARTLRIWVAATQPVVFVEADGPEAFTMHVAVETWRTEEREIKGRELFSAYGVAGAPHPIIVHPDTVLSGQENRIAWFHRNPTSVWPETLELQGMGDWAQEAADPLLNRTFGGIVYGEGLVGVADDRLRSAGPSANQRVAVLLHTAQTETEEEWLRQAETKAREIEEVGAAQLRSDHDLWWEDFWRRSWIHTTATTFGEATTTNDLPLRIGADSDGSNEFRGHMRRARVFSRALTSDELKALADGIDSEPADRTGLVGDWRLDSIVDGVCANRAGDDLMAEVVGDVAVEEVAGMRAARFTGQGWLEIADCAALDLDRAMTLEAWVRPEQLPGGGARIIDKSRAGTSNGYLLDTYPGNSLRMILEPGTLSHSAGLPPGRWSHVAATFDGETGEQRLYLNGAEIASQGFGSGPYHVAQAYALQRFITACAGRGAYPIKFNGSLFTVDAVEGAETYNADYRRWGGPYWFQNTRLAYWPMPASGDWEMMIPLFRMYMDALPLAQERTRLYFHHGGAFFPETMYFWGSYANENYGWNREGKHPSHVDNTYIRYYYSGALELLALMLNYYEYTGDETFAQETLVPFAAEILAFYDEQYARDDDGKRRFEPAQSLETWQKAIDPLPPIAGLRFVLPRLLALPPGLVDNATRVRWELLLEDLPDLPMSETGEGPALAPAAEVLEGIKNSENPELYAVYPYRLYGVGKPDLDMARRTFARRRVKGSRGWQQDDTQAAFLGLAKEASTLLARRFAAKDPGSRFPAFWGPNFDWIPDQDHGTNGLMALQTMLLQAEGDRILLFPAWPKEWDVDFKLHAPKRTIVEGRYRGGKLEALTVTPEARRGDVQILDPQ